MDGFEQVIEKMLIRIGITVLLGLSVGFAFLICLGAFVVGV